MNSILNRPMFCTFALIAFLFCSTELFAQTPPIGGGGINPGDLNNDILNQINNAGGVGGGGNTGTGEGVGNGPLTEGFSPIMIDIEPDQRNLRGFVGVSTEDPDSIFPEFRFVGPQGTETGQTTASAGGGPIGFGADPFNTGLNSPEVQRTATIRARIVPRFQARQISPQFVATSINRRMSDIPSMRPLGGRVNVAMQGKTAVISGTLRDQSELNKLSRQLRLEPGVSRVESRASFSGR